MLVLWFEKKILLEETNRDLFIEIKRNHRTVSEKPAWEQLENLSNDRQTDKIMHTQLQSDPDRAHLVVSLDFFFLGKKDPVHDLGPLSCKACLGSILCA